MNVVNFNERSCERYRRYFDAYLDNELLVETNQDVLQHLTTCRAVSYTHLTLPTILRV